MSTKNKAQAKASGVNEHQAKTRLLLGLWDMGGAKEEVKKSELIKRILQTKEKAGDYQVFFEKLEEEGAITTTTKNRSVKVALTDNGLQMLDAGLKSPDFESSGKQVRAKDFNTLLKWIRHLDGAVSTSNGQAKPTAAAIASYEDFKPVALKVYDQLNQDYNLDSLVPIYRIRRMIGDRVTRSQFNEWLLEMQADDILQLLEGSVEDSAPDKLEDSITTKVSGLRCYAKRLTP
jgi:DNA-binding PadR family transcriptional regulator